MNRTNFGIRGTYVVLLLVLLTLLGASAGLARPVPLTVTFLDIGQGDSIYVHFPDGRTMLVDAADSSHGQTVVDYLRSCGVKQIDILVATHPHADHIGGMAAVLAAFKIGKVWDSGFNSGSQVQSQFLQTIKTKGIRYGTPKAGFTEQIGAVRVDVLAPVKALSGTDSDANNNSLVLRISYGQTSFLLTGDMEAEERATVPSLPKSTVLKVSHHGSSNGTDAKFLGAVAPSIAVISVAAQNDYGHPHAATLSALKKTGAKVYLTSTSGTIAIEADGMNVNVSESKTAKTTPVTPVAPAASVNNQYIGNRNSQVFHLPTCSSLPAERNRLYFKSRSEAVSQGYRPCGRCKP